MMNQFAARRVFIGPNGGDFAWVSQVWSERGDFSTTLPCYVDMSGSPMHATPEQAIAWAGDNAAVMP